MYICTILVIVITEKRIPFFFKYHATLKHFSHAAIWHYLFVICCVYTLCDLKLETTSNEIAVLLHFVKSAIHILSVGYIYPLCYFFAFLILKPVAIYAYLMQWGMFGTNWKGSNVGLICILVYLCTDSMICLAQLPEMHLLLNYIFIPAFYQQKTDSLFCCCDTQAKVVAHLSYTTNVLQFVDSGNHPQQPLSWLSSAQAKKSRYAT
jgi:hypothetical protein